MMPLRIGLATPWNSKSAIAKHSAEIGFELASRGHSIMILRTEVGASRDLPPRAAPGAVHFLSDFSDDTLLRGFDVIIGQFGNYLDFHGALLPRLETVPVVGIFHDLCIAHLMRSWLNDDRDRLQEMVRKTYAGTPAAETAPNWDDLFHISHHHPMIEWAAARTIAGVVHAHHYAQRVIDACNGPVAVIPMAFEMAEFPPVPTPRADRMTIAVVGHANPNKRIDQILFAMSASPYLRQHCRLKIIGEVEPAMRGHLASVAARYDVAPPTITGWVSDDDLLGNFHDVDVVCCLRYPVFEGASGSHLLGLLSGRPILVSNHGAYAEVPDDAELKCTPGREALGVLLHLERLVRDPALGIAIGARGRAFATERHSAAAYTDALEPLLERCVADRAPLGARYSFRGTLASFGLQWDDPAISRLMGALDNMLERA